MEFSVRESVKVNKISSESSASKKKPLQRNVSLASWVGRIFLMVFLGWIFAGILIIPLSERAVLLRFGKYYGTLLPGFNWIFPFIDQAELLNVENINDLSYQAELLTKDENLVAMKANVSYKVLAPDNFLFSFVNPVGRLKLAIASALNQVISATSLQDILSDDPTEKSALQKQFLESLTQQLDDNQTALRITHVSLEPVLPDEALASAFSSILRAKEESKIKFDAAKSYKEEAIKTAKRNAQNLLMEAEGYQKQVVLTAEADAAEYLALLAAYKKAPEVTKTRLYLEALDAILSNNKAVLIDVKESGHLHLSLPKSAFELKLNEEKPSNLPLVSEDAKTLPAKTTENISRELRTDAPEDGGYPKGDLDHEGL
jgi:modulator of FtsH protease HflK